MNFEQDDWAISSTIKPLSQPGYEPTFTSAYGSLSLAEIELIEMFRLKKQSRGISSNSIFTAKDFINFYSGHTDDHKTSAGSSKSHNDLRLPSPAKLKSTMPERNETPPKIPVVTEAKKIIPKSTKSEPEKKEVIKEVVATKQEVKHEPAKEVVKEKPKQQAVKAKAKAPVKPPAEVKPKPVEPIKEIEPEPVKSIEPEAVKLAEPEPVIFIEKIKVVATVEEKPEPAVVAEHIVVVEPPPNTEVKEVQVIEEPIQQPLPEPEPVIEAPLPVKVEIIPVVVQKTKIALDSGTPSLSDDDSVRKGTANLISYTQNFNDFNKSTSSNSTTGSKIKIKMASREVEEEETDDVVHAEEEPAAEKIGALTGRGSSSFSSMIDDIDSLISKDNITIQSEEPEPDDDDFASLPFNSSKANEADEMQLMLANGLQTMPFSRTPIIPNGPDFTRSQSWRKGGTYLAQGNARVVTSRQKAQFKLDHETHNKGTSTDDLQLFDTAMPQFKKMEPTRISLSAALGTPAFSSSGDPKSLQLSRSMDVGLLVKPKDKRGSCGPLATITKERLAPKLAAITSSTEKKKLSSSMTTKSSAAVFATEVSSPVVHNNAISDADTMTDTSSIQAAHENVFSKLHESEFAQQLQASVNPLLEIYNKYHASLPKSWKAKLLTTATAVQGTSLGHVYTLSSPSINSNDSFNIEEQQKIIAAGGIPYMMNIPDEPLKEIQFANIKSQFESNIHVLENLKQTSINNMTRLQKCERLTSELLEMMTDTSADGKVYQEKVETLFRKIGVLDASKMFVEVQLANFRGMFEEIQAISETSFPTMMRDVPELKKSYNLFISTQGKIVKLGRRLKALKTYCATVQLLSPHMNATMRPENYDTNNRTEMDYYVFEEVERLDIELEQTKQKNERLQEEMCHLINKNDDSPGPLAFYSALNDPSLITSLKALKDDLSVLRDFSNLSEHIDFATLRVSLKRCVTATPSLERFVHKFTALHKRWSRRRIEMFYLKQRDGIPVGTEDIINDEKETCPICCHDRKIDPDFSKDVQKKILLQKVMNVTRSGALGSSASWDSLNQSSVPTSYNDSSNFAPSIYQQQSPQSQQQSVLRPQQMIMMLPPSHSSSEGMLPKLANR